MRADRLAANTVQMTRTVMRGSFGWVLAAAVLLRLLIPAGMMPDAGQLVLCTGAGAVVVVVGPDGHLEKRAPALPGHAVPPCAFAAVSGLDVPGGVAAISPRPPVILASFVQGHSPLRLGEGLGRPPMPSTRPPARN